MAHTPGPWKPDPVDPLVVMGSDADERVVADCGHAIVMGDEQAVANAHLIAAAPELLAACKEFVRKCDHGEARSIRSYAEMSAAITKAEGR